MQTSLKVMRFVITAICLSPGQKDYIERVKPNLWEFGGKASGKGRNDSILVWKKTAKLGLIEDLLPKCRCKKMMYCFVLLIFLYYIINIR